MKWRESLATAFKTYASPDEIDADLFLSLLENNGLYVSNKLEELYGKLSLPKKKTVIENLWKLVYADKLSDAERIELYKALSSDWLQFYELEDEEFPGW